MAKPRASSGRVGAMGNDLFSVLARILIGPGSMPVMSSSLMTANDGLRKFAVNDRNAQVDNRGRFGRLGRSSSLADAGYEGEFQPNWEAWSRENETLAGLNALGNQTADPLGAGVARVMAGKYPNPGGWRPLLHDPGFVGGVKQGSTGPGGGTFNYPLSNPYKLKVG